MKPIASYMDIYLVVKFDSYEDLYKAEELLNADNEISGEIIPKATVLTCCPHCGDTSCFSSGYCTNCGKYYDEK